MQLIIDFRSQYGHMIQEVLRTLESKVRLVVDTAITAHEATSGGEEIIIPDNACETFMECLGSNIRELMERPVIVDSRNFGSADELADVVSQMYITLQHEVDQALQMTELERYFSVDDRYSTATPLALKDLLIGTAWQEIHEAIKAAGARHGEIYRGVVEDFINKVKSKP